jgi:outer membrane protein assembly factor BamB
VLAALQLDTGEMLWESDLSGGKTEFIDVDRQPVPAGSRVYAASYDGGVFAVDKFSGEHIWRTPLTGVTDVVYGDQTLYVTTAGGRVVALGAEDGEPKWAFKFEEAAPVAMTATQLYLFVSTASGPIYALDRLTGYPLTTWNPSSGFNTSLVLGENGAYAYSNRGYLYGLDIAF